METLPWVYLDIEQVLAASIYRSRSQLYKAIKAGKFPSPEHHGGRSLWRSDLVAQANHEAAARAATEGEQKARKMQERAQRLVSARDEKARRDSRL